MNDWDKLREGEDHKTKENGHRCQNNRALDAVERNPDGHQLISSDFYVCMFSDKIMVGAFQFMEVSSQEVDSVIYGNADSYTDD